MKKSELFIVHVTGLCHDGCARMAGQKYLIKIIFGVGEERHGVLPGSPLLCLVSFLFFMHSPCTCTCTRTRTQLNVHRSSSYLFIQEQATHVDLLNMAMDKATFLLQRSIRGTCQFSSQNLFTYEFILNRSSWLNYNLYTYF